MKFCFTIGGTRICLDIPVLIIKWPWPGPDPDPDPPWRRWIQGLGGPDPSPWRDIVVVATLHAVARELEDDRLKETILPALDALTDTLRRDLPDGVELLSGGKL
jgi:hypothetical protein